MQSHRLIPNQAPKYEYTFSPNYRKYMVIIEVDIHLERLLYYILEKVSPYLLLEEIQIYSSAKPEINIIKGNLYFCPGDESGKLQP